MGERETTVRVARREDHARLIELLEQLFAGGDDARAPAWREGIPDLLRSDRLRVLVVEDDANVVEDDANVVEDDANAVEDDANVVEDDANAVEDDANVVEDANVVGLISFSFNLALRYAGEYCQIEELIVDPRGRGRKLGALLVRSAVEQARERGCVEIGLYAREETRAFYEKLGFRYRGPEVRMSLL